MLSISLTLRIAETMVNLAIGFWNVKVDDIVIDNPSYTLSNLIIPVGFAGYHILPAS